MSALDLRRPSPHPKENMQAKISNSLLEIF